MKAVFVDSLYWTAICRPHDPWRDAANAAKATLGPVPMVTTDEVLNEFLTAMSAGGPKVRQAGAKIVAAVLGHPQITVVPQTREGFLGGLKRYAARSDKSYSLTDCISMNVMESRGISQILSNDHHFEQEGFSVLINSRR
jgi:predicted nucleic acid-binding protein